jgi:adenylate cyclase
VGETRKLAAEKGTHSKNPDAIDLTMRGWALYWQEEAKPTKDKNDAVRGLFDQALKIDPNDADALAGEAICYAVEHFNWANPETDYDAKVIGPADRAIALAPDTMRAYWAKSVYLFVAHRADEALRTADAGLAINPNDAPLYGARRLL